MLKDNSIEIEKEVFSVTRANTVLRHNIRRYFYVFITLILGDEFLFIRKRWEEKIVPIFVYNFHPTVCQNKKIPPKLNVKYIKNDSHGIWADPYFYPSPAE